MEYLRELRVDPIGSLRDAGGDCPALKTINTGVVLWTTVSEDYSI